LARRLQVGLRGVARGERFVVVGLGRHQLGHQVGLALVLGFVLLERRGGADHRRLRRLDLEPVRLRLDGEQRGALLDEVAVGIADGLHEPLHARHQIDRIDGRRVAGRLEIIGHFALDGIGDGDLGRRRRGVAIVLPAGGDRQRGNECKHGSHGAGFGHERTLVEFRQNRLDQSDGATAASASDFKAALARQNRLRTAQAVRTTPAAIARRRSRSSR